MESEEKGGGGGGEAGPTTGHRPLLCLRTCKISLTGAKKQLWLQHLECEKKYCGSSSSCAVVIKYLWVCCGIKTILFWCEVCAILFHFSMFGLKSFAVFSIIGKHTPITKAST